MCQTPVFRIILTAFIASLAFTNVYSQTDAEFTGNENSAYYDFWPGLWLEVIDGKPNSLGTIFRVKRALNSHTFIEEWTQVDGGMAQDSIAIRSWDQIDNRWKFVWIGENALFQVWDTERVGDHWYIVKHWNINGRTFLTRQAWIDLGDGIVERIFERSFDNRASWETVSRTKFQRVPTADESP